LHPRILASSTPSPPVTHYIPGSPKNGNAGLHVPKELVEQVQKRVAAGREFQDAVREVLRANAELLA
jgi:hypothetical protein